MGIEIWFPHARTTLQHDRGDHRESELGMVLDVIADNILRGCMWVASARADRRFLMPAVIAITLEFLTFWANKVSIQGPTDKCHPFLLYAVW